MLKGAIVGFGEVACHGHLPGYAQSDLLRIIAIVEGSAERRQLATRLVPGVGTFGSVDELGQSGLAIDFVDVCTPPIWHAPPMVAAIERGWHVLCEKPMLLDPAVLDLVRERALTRQRAVVPVHNWRYAPIVRHATQLLRDGEIGRLRHVDIETVRLRHFAGADPTRPNWRRDPTIAGGGILMDHGWHAVYLALDWFGGTPTAVGGSLHRVETSSVEDEASVTLRFPNGEATIELTWNGAVRRNTMRLIGEVGTITIDDDLLTVDARGTSRSLRFDAALSAGSHHPDWFAAMLPDVSAAFQSLPVARVAFDQAAACLSVIRQAYAAAALTPPVSAACTPE